jgi:regulator of RNase E activity RraB
MDSAKLQESVSAHEQRNAALHRSFVEKNIDMRAPRDIDIHFWAQGQANASQLTESFRRLGYEVSVQRPTRDDRDRWNVEAHVTQSIDLTMRREFITDLVQLADSHGAVFDGWGTLL